MRFSAIPPNILMISKPFNLGGCAAAAEISEEVVAVDDEELGTGIAPAPPVEAGEEVTSAAGVSR